MDNQKFIKLFAEAVEVESVESLSVETVFRELDEWNSLAYLSVIAMLDDEYEVQIENANFKTLITIGDIINYVESHK
ncbi:acyl carrier protein [uncultured Parabacteroides sp.]|mgnify:CR=1 FL=1|jgi:acyl carrier protein|uniref:acyl carrier protein n=1 Tax=uncultured Parabacteroides sp. TaxID=512312 RepID=UPI00259A769E|nr:acyl carrier protein [uncultured Parabacteroides sp.]